MATPARAPKVAIVGSGLAGLTAAWLLQQEADRGRPVEVHLFEKAATLGFHSSSLVVPLEGNTSTSEKGSAADGPETSRSWTVDVPMRSLQGGYYARLIKMYRKLGIKLQPTYYTYSFSHLRADGERPRTHFLHQGRSGLASLALPAGGLRTKIAGVLRLVQYALCYLYLLVLAYAYRETGSPGGSVAAWAAETGRGRWVDWIAVRWEQFVREMLYTLFGAISSASDQQLENVDIGLFLDYVWLTILTPHYSVPTSSASVAAALVAPLPASNIHLATTITSIRRVDGLYTITAETPAGQVEMGGFTDVVLATQANQARAILKTVELDAAAGGAHVKEIVDCLGSFRYVSTIVINHRDPSVLPTSQQDHRDLNLVRCPTPPPASASPSEKAGALNHFPPTPDESFTMATHIMRCPVAGQPPVYQTTNPIVPIDPSKVLSVAKLERALPTAESTANLSRLHDLQGSSGLWFVGAYAWEGIPLLEGCVASAEEVVLGPAGIFARGATTAP